VCPMSFDGSLACLTMSTVDNNSGPRMVWCLLYCTCARYESGII
jgi:hypothetical protein